MSNNLSAIEQVRRRGAKGHAVESNGQVATVACLGCRLVGRECKFWNESGVCKCQHCYAESRTCVAGQPSVPHQGPSASTHVFAKGFNWNQDLSLLSPARERYAAMEAARDEGEEDDDNNNDNGDGNVRPLPPRRMRTRKRPAPVVESDGEDDDNDESSESASNTFVKRLKLLSKDAKAQHDELRRLRVENRDLKARLTTAEAIIGRLTVAQNRAFGVEVVRRAPPEVIEIESDHTEESDLTEMDEEDDERVEEELSGVAGLITKIPKCFSMVSPSF